MTDKAGPQDEPIKEGNPSGTALKRRGVIAGVGALVAGALAMRASQDVGATSGGGGEGAFILGSNPDNGSNLSVKTNWVRAGSGFAFSTNSGSALFTSDAVGFVGGTPNIDGIRGIGNGTFTGVVGAGGPNGGAGVIGFGGGQGTATGIGAAVVGVAAGAANPTPGSVPCGVFGTGNGASRPGVIGDAQTSDGVQGFTSSGRGVLGQASGTGVGVFGNSAGNYGVLGISTAAGFAGLTGITATANVAAFAGGSSTPLARAAQFNGGVLVDCTTGGGGQFVVNPMSAKFGTVQHTDGSLRLMASMEAPQSWAVDIGEAQLANGSADVKFDPDFASVIEGNGYRVLLTPLGDCKGLYASNLTAKGFAVHELQAGTSSISFTWQVAAHPRGQKSERLQKFDPGKAVKFVIPKDQPAGDPVHAAPLPPPPSEQRRP